MKIKLLFLTIITILFTGCAVSEKTAIEPQLIYNNYKKVENKPEEIQNLYVNYYVDEKRNQVLNLMRMGLYAYQNGYYKDASFAFDKSLMHIESLYGETELSEKAKSIWYGEDQKFFVGEPYERAMAYYYRGQLYLKNGDYENARASFKSGLLQDARAEDKEYQADFLSLILLEALTSKANGDDELYKDAINEFLSLYIPVETTITEDTIITPTSNYEIPSSITSRSKCLNYNGDIDWNDKIKQYSCQVKGRLFYFTVEQDNQAIDNKSIRKISSHDECLVYKGKVDWNDKIEKYSCQIKGNIFYYEKIDSIDEIEKDEIDSDEIILLENTGSISEHIEKSNVFIFIDTGLGPVKVTSGKNDSELSFKSRSYQNISPKISINNVSKNAFKLDDLYFQASTRGGREIDKIISGKAAFKDETRETGEALSTAGAAGLYASATAAMASDNEYVQSAAGVVALVSLAALAVGKVAEASSDAMIASADPRYWDNLPGSIYVYMDSLPSGKHLINIQAETLKTIEIDVPENSIVIKHVMPNIQKPLVVVSDQEIRNVIKDKDKYDTKYQQISKGEENNETIGNKLNNFISDFKF